MEVAVLALVLFLLWVVFAAVPTVFYVMKPVLHQVTSYDYSYMHV